MSGEAPKPARIELFPNGEIGIAWSDGEEHFIPAAVVRGACPCAECVDELTGERRLDPRSVASVRALDWDTVGSYAVSFRWSDGHSTGIYAFDRLRRLAEALG